ncbi:bifunctional glutamate N-acetyltransferase/amino-acid acetyltransferase ArgJ [Granulicella sp. WH15]|uniref:bifunctional glutamate N-acetyltransferase/amino-acid acetyltransferase ArgJ n=1 Tax=Granulicella sp. WH15 TaxID=2602070 RepID=UPI001367910E|nr:bifunctional glutamate N-acetyltransferase/amino-acid acetyltransferase ArgJ [Granulicella sp. WH15]QHN03119.1 bifunctional glutamate N-acetyltransferase/amino-acid acetyltransferase ArgJ [Granulicella sp. WH15]
MDKSLEQVGALPRGFEWGAVKAGIKASGKLDVAVARAPKGANAAAMFTRNRMVAAPVTVGRRHLAATGGRVSVVLVNAGNANCATGEPGIAACLESCKAAGDQFGCIFDEVFPSSTGIIGVPLPVEKLIGALPSAAAALGATAAHAETFATAIMTTDTRMKVARATIETDDGPVYIFGAAKGAGMIYPQLGPPHATMLVYLFTDLVAQPTDLREMMEPAVESSFNSISIDGDTSTNDTVLLLASGASGVGLDERVSVAFANALRLVCGSLAHQIVDDGEGVGHVVTLQINGAASYADAKAVAQTIAHSPLCKTAWSSADPNWGRLLAAAGRSGVALDPAATRIWIGAEPVFENGVRSPLYNEAAAHQVMLAREYTITLDLGQGEASCTFLTCDLTEEYVKINADYST